jgi:hypothetical protein
MGRWMFFLGGRGGKRSSRVRVPEKFSQDERTPNSPVCVIYHMLSSGGFASTCLQVIAKGGSSILGRPGQTLFNTYLCNQPYYYQVVVEPGTQFCTLLEVWVLRVGMSTLGHKRLCTPRIGDSQVPMTLEHDNFR